MTTNYPVLKELAALRDDALALAALDRPQGVDPSRVAGVAAAAREQFFSLLNDLDEAARRRDDFAARCLQASNIVDAARPMLALLRDALVAKRDEVTGDITQVEDVLAEIASLHFDEEEDE